jgi:hypothetical protein
VGRRLYLYVGGHGFGRNRLDGAVFTANATVTRPGYLDATSWARWFQQSSYFDEYVLWMDCCMRPEALIKPRAVGFGTVSPTRPARIFQSFAARFPGLAVEAVMEDGAVHGAFTWALLQGLHGANANPVTGEVTTARLRDYLVNSMRDFMTPDQLADPAVSNEPDFGPDEDLVLASIRPATSAITLTFESLANGHSWRILTAAMAVMASGIAAPAGATIRLPAGAYVAEVEGTDLSAGFQVIGKDLAVHVG